MEDKKKPSISSPATKFFIVLLFIFFLDIHGGGHYSFHASARKLPNVEEENRSVVDISNNENSATSGSRRSLLSNGLAITPAMGWLTSHYYISIN